MFKIKRNRKKKQFRKVFTPMNLINEMLNILPLKI